MQVPCPLMNLMNGCQQFPIYPCYLALVRVVTPTLVGQAIAISVFSFHLVGLAPSF